MIPDNDWYGHKAILGRYCELRRPRPIAGLLAHGWGPQMPPGYGKSHIPFMRNFVWNERDTRDLRRSGLKAVFPIGAPFLYLLRSSGPQPRPMAPSGTVAFLSHSAEKENLLADRLRVLDYAETVGDPPFTAVVFYQDLQPELLLHLKDRKWGYVWFGKRSDADFLVRLRDNLAMYRLAVGDFMQTGLLYAGALGLDISLRGLDTHRHDHPFLNYELDNLRRWELENGQDFRGGDAKALALAELGAEFLLDPIELRQALGWSSIPLRVYASAIGKWVDLSGPKGARLGDFPVSWTR